MRQSWRDADGSWRTKLRGRQVFADPRLNKGTAFDATERQALGLVGLLRPRILHLDEQAARSYGQFRAQPNVSATVAAAVAWAAVADGVGAVPAGLAGTGGPADLAGIVEKAMWSPVYRPVLPA